MEKLMSPGNHRDSRKLGNQELKKLSLQRQTLELFYTQGHKTISDLCGIVNVSIPTMASIMTELIGEGWVKKVGIADSRGGRKPAIYGLKENARFIIGVDLSRRYTRMAIFNLNNEPIHEIKEISEGLDTREDILQIIKSEVHDLLSHNSITPKHVLGYGITIPGLIDTKKGVSYSYPHFGDRPVAESFSALFNGPAFIEHDTKAMAVGESWFGQAKNKSNVLCLNVGSGIGLGIIINGALYQGHSGYSGEFGHIQMVPNGDLCYCGKIGCLETIASGTAMIKKARHGIENGKSTIISSYVEGSIEKIRLRTIIKAANQGDQFAIELIEESGEYLAKGIAVLIHLFNPEAIIVGGDIASAGNLIIDPIQQKLNKYTMTRLRQDTTILLSSLKEKAGLLGTVPVVMTNIFSTGLTPDN